MKGLLIKDYYVIKKNLYISFGVCVYFFIMVLVGSKDSTSSDIDFIMYFLCVSLVVGICVFIKINLSTNITFPKKSFIFLLVLSLDVFSTFISYYFSKKTGEHLI